MADKKIKDKMAGTTPQNVLIRILNRVAAAIRVIAYGYDGSNYVAFKTSSGGVVKTCDVQGPGGPTRVSADILSSVKLSASVTNQVTRVTSDVQNTAASALFVRPGTGASFALAAGTEWAAKVSAQLLNQLSRVSADVLSSAKLSATVTNQVTRVTSDLVDPVKVSAGTQWAAKVSSQILNPVSRVSADILSSTKVSAAVTNQVTRVTSDLVDPVKVSAGTQIVGKVSAVPIVTTIAASAAWNAAGSAQVVAGSAGYYRGISDLIISNYIDDSDVYLYKEGGGKITPRMMLKEGSGLSHAFGMPVQVSASVALKVSAVGAGSGQVVVHYYTYT